MIHKVFKSDIFKSIILSSFKRSFQPINLFVGVVLGYISPIAFPKECSYLWCLSMIKFSPSHLGEEVFFSLLISIQSTVSVVAEFRLYLEKFSISPLQAYSFRCWFFQQLRSTLPLKMPLQALLWQKLAFSSPFLYSNDLSSIFSSGGMVMLLSSLIISNCEDRVLFVLIHFQPECRALFSSSSHSVKFCLPSQPECCLKSFLPIMPFFQ